MLPQTDNQTVGYSIKLLEAFKESIQTSKALGYLQICKSFANQVSMSEDIITLQRVYQGAQSLFVWHTCDIGHKIFHRDDIVLCTGRFSK